MSAPNDVSFWQSQLFSALIISTVTFIVGLIAFFLYRKQLIDKKKDAANIVLLEIKNAEAHLAQAKETIIKDDVLPEYTFAMKSSSWSQYSYLFVRDLTDEEWGLINDFYEKCRLYDEIVEYNNTFFKKNEEQTRINRHQALSEYTKKYIEALFEAYDEGDDKKREKGIKDLDDGLASVLERFSSTYMDRLINNDYQYAPQKAFLDGRATISTIRLDLSTSTIGVKFERIINQSFRSRLFDRLAGVKK